MSVFVGWLVSRSVGRTFFPRRAGKLHFHAPYYSK